MSNLAQHLCKWSDVCRELEQKQEHCNALLWVKGYVSGLTAGMEFHSRVIAASAKTTSTLGATDWPSNHAEDNV